MDCKTFQFNNSGELYISVANMILESSLKAVEEKGVFNLVLSGGKTPKILYKTLTMPDFIDQIPWSKIKFFFADERYLPLNHQDSNFYLANRYLFSKINVSERNIFPIPVDSCISKEEAAEVYEGIIKKECGVSHDTLIPSFDLVILGVGKDGHTASIFPGSSALYDEKLVSSIFYKLADITPDRVTLTLKAINNAKIVAFIVTGNEKKDVVNEILSRSDYAEINYPAAIVGAKKLLFWFLALD